MGEFDPGLFARRLNLVLSCRMGEHGRYSNWARAHGFNQTSMTNWLHGKYQPGVAQLHKLCRELDVSADYLMGLEE